MMCSKYSIIGVQVSNIINQATPNQTVNRLKSVSDLGKSSQTYFTLFLTMSYPRFGKLHFMWVTPKTFMLGL